MTITDFLNPNALLGQAVWALCFLSLLTAPMGCFIVWRKLSYFGATLSHSALLGAVLGLVTGVGILFGVMGFTFVLALGLSFWLQHKHLSSDTVLGIMAHTTLALGVIVISLMDDLRMDLMAYLFGDVLSLPLSLFYALCVMSVVGLVMIVYFWKGFINLAIQPDIAKVEGYATQQLELVFILALSLTISLGILSIGVLLIVSMLIIPAATARLFARSLVQMAVIAWVISVGCSVFGLWAAYWLDFPAGPTVVVSAGCVFIISYILRHLVVKQ